MNPLDALIRKYVAPVMKEAGFRRKGLEFRLSNGDSAILGFSRDVVDLDSTVFLVDIFAIPKEYWEWQNRHEVDAGIPDRGDAMARGSLIPPREVAYSPDEQMPFRARWAFSDVNSEEACGLALADELRTNAIPRLRGFLRRENLLLEMRDPDSDLGKRMTSRMREIILQLDSGDVQEVYSLLLEAEAVGEFPAFIQWARDRVALRDGRV